MSFGVFAYKTPRYLVEATKKKYGRDIAVIGATKKDIDAFWQQVGYRVEHGQQIQKPLQITKTVVDIDCKTHVNSAVKYLEEGPKGPKKSDDWYDDFQITSKKAKDESRSKSYNLKLTNTTAYDVGGNFDIQNSGFFNLVGPGVIPNVGLGAKGKYSSSKTKEEETFEEREERLSQIYEIVDTLKVPPRTKVKAKITTYAVTHESTTVTRLTVDAKAHIKVLYASSFSKLLGNLWKSHGFITAEELFADEEYEEEDGSITFTREGKVSYIGEEVEIHKTSWAQF